MNNDRARLLADVFHRIGPDAEDVLHIYVDGLVMALGGSSDRHLAVRDVLKKDFPNGFEEARRGNLSVFVVPMDLGWDAITADLPPLFVATTHKGYHDHRNEGSYSMDSAVGLMSAALEVQR